MKQSINKLMLLLFSSFLFSTSIYAIIDYDDSFVITVEVQYKNFTVLTDPNFNYSYYVQCTEGAVWSELQTTDYKCTYDSDGIHQISIEGAYPYSPNYPYVNSNSDRVKSIEQWGTGSWHSMHDSFGGLQINATDTPDLRYVSDMSEMFSNSTFNNDSIRNWDVSNVTNMSWMFYRTTLNAIISLNSWDVSNVTNMKLMFQGADNFDGLYAWDVSSVIDMNGMFVDSYFNHSIGFWDVSNVIDMSYMFANSPFNHEIKDWNVSSVANMKRMFHRNSAFNQDIGNWDVSNVTTMEEMFASATVFNQDIGDWNVSKVTNMANMFYIAVLFNQDIGNWDVSNVTTIAKMFDNAKAFNQDIGGWDVSNVTDMNLTFSVASKFNQDIGNWDISNVESMRYMFYWATDFNQDIGDWDVSNVSSMYNMFSNATAFNQDIGDWDISNITNMYKMFDQVHISLSNYDNLLFSWAQLTLQQDVTFDAGESYYCRGLFSKNLLEGGDGWTINDLGENCESFRITSSNTMSVISGEKDIGMVTATTVAEDAYFTHSVNIADGDKFYINENGGLSFINPPDFNNPTDKNGDNIYRVQVYGYAYGSTDEKDYQTIKITVMPEEVDKSLVPIITYLLF